MLWAGGDAPNQMDWLKTAFESRFPGVTLDVTVDLSKFHDLRIDQELAAGTLTPDVAMLQTTFDFDRWKARDVLLRQPVGFARQKKGYADPDGAYVTAYNNAYRADLRFRPAASGALSDALADYLKPAFKGKPVLTYPMTTMRCCTSTTSWNGATAAVSCAPWRRRSRTSCAARRRRRPRWAPTPSVRWAT
ncbi:hypothetical protein P4233_20240 [Pseudomonas aeruginosa]|nr:hypothetical protein [Pseudomonas aeruginosa]